MICWCKSLAWVRELHCFKTVGVTVGVEGGEAAVKEEEE